MEMSAFWTSAECWNQPTNPAMRSRKSRPATLLSPTNNRLVLCHTRAPGDVVVMTALPRDIARAYPGKYLVDVETSHPEIWQNNPYLTPGLSRELGVCRVRLDYGTCMPRESRPAVHFLTAFHTNLKFQTGLEVPLTEPKPDLHLGKEERQPLVSGRYWVVFSGGKHDFDTKWPVAARIQKVVTILRSFGIGFVQVGGRNSGSARHAHPPLQGVLDLIGRTSLRDLIRLIAGADGVLCTITLGMHIAAAMERPCVVTGGGRESQVWEAYSNDHRGFGPIASGRVRVPHRFIHSIGQLPCAVPSGCWKNKTRPVRNDSKVCKKPVLAEGGQWVPVCQDMITTEQLVESVLSYYQDGTLEPLAGGQYDPVGRDADDCAAGRSQDSAEAGDRKCTRRAADAACAST